MTGTVEARSPVEAAPATAGPRKGGAGPIDRIAAHLRVPLHRAGYSLISNAVMTSALGLAFWAVAARRAPAAAVGATGALLAAMRLISHVADLGLRTGIVRFLPALRDRGRSIVLSTYAVTGLAAAAAAAVFVAVHGRWFDDLTLLDRPVGAALFIAASAVWVVFVIQDSVLVALRRAAWVPIENGAYGLVKLILLVAAIGTFPQWGIYLAWVAPLPVLVGVVGLLIVGRELPALAREPGVERADLGDLARYSAGDYGGSLLWHSTLEVMPLLVLALAGATDSAYYTLSATIAMSLYLIPSAVGYAFVAEAAHDPASEALNLRRAARQSISLVLPAALVVILAAPLILSILGPDYRSEATTLLRLLAASAVPQVATSLAVNLHRARRDVARVVRLYALVCVSVLGLGVVLVTRYGATGAGLAWLSAQTLVATVLLATTLRETWVSAVPTRHLRLLGAGPRALAGRWHGLRARQRATRFLAGTAEGHRVGVLRCRVLQATSDEAVIVVHGDAERALVLKSAQSRPAELSRRREHHVLTRLHADPRIEDWTKLVPEPRMAVTDAGASWFAETYLEGTSGDHLVRAGRGAIVVDAGIEALSVLHAATANVRTVDAALLHRWVDDPAQQIVAGLPHVEAGIRRIGEEISDGLMGRVVITAACHGDLHTGNLIMDRDGSAVVGIVDWVDARDGWLPEIDVLNLAVAARADAEHAEMGALLGDLAASGNDPVIGPLLARLPSAGVNGDIPSRVLMLHTWLDHIAMNLKVSSSYERNRAWVVRNVEHTIATVAGSPASERDEPGATIDRADVRAPVTGRRATGWDRPAMEPSPATPVTVSVPTGEPPVTEPLEAGHGPAPAGRRQGWTPAALAVSITLGPLLWWLGFERIDPRAVGGTGPAGGLPAVAFVGLGLVVAGFALALSAPRPREGWLAAHTGALVAMLYAVPVVVYGTARYSWSWKHVGIVDYIARFGAVDPTIEVGDVYHNWPGFFAAAEVLAESTGADPVTLARWAPAFFSLAVAAGAWFLLAALVDDRRVVWLGTWSAVLVNWVGQEYFSPQATAMVLYLVTLGLVLRIEPERRRGGAVAVIAVVALLAATASSHQLTPIMLTVSLAGLAVLGCRGTGSLALVAGVFTSAWAVWVAFAFVGPELADEVGSLGSIFGNAGDTLVDTRQVSADQAFVSTVGRGLIVVTLVLVLMGAVRVQRGGRLPPPAVWLLLAPLALVAFNDFGGEILLRALLFASPLIGLFVAWALLGAESRPGPRTAVAVVAVSGVLLGGFLIAHFGKDGRYVFSPEEVAAAEYVAATAPDGALLVEGSRNYPKQFRNYEYLRYVPIERESDATRRRIDADPVGELSEWMTDPEDAAAYLLITRSQKEEMDALGIGPPGLLQRVEDELRSSPQFAVVFENRDAVVIVSTERSP